MGRKKHCTPKKRKIKMTDQGLSIVDILKNIRIFQKMVYKVINKYYITHLNRKYNKRTS